METFANILKDLRAESGLSLKRVADAVGASDVAVYKWESGLAEPKVCYLIKLAELFDCTVDYLVGKTNDFIEPPATALPTRDEQKLLAAYRKLSAEKRELLKKTIGVWL